MVRPSQLASQVIINATVDINTYTQFPISFLSLESSHIQPASYQYSSVYISYYIATMQLQLIIYNRCSRNPRSIAVYIWLHVLDQFCHYSQLYGQLASQCTSSLRYKLASYNGYAIRRPQHGALNNSYTYKKSQQSQACGGAILYRHTSYYHV